MTALMAFFFFFFAYAWDPQSHHTEVTATPFKASWAEIDSARIEPMIVYNFHASANIHDRSTVLFYVNLGRQRKKSVGQMLSMLSFQSYFLPSAAIVSQGCCQSLTWASNSFLSKGKGEATVNYVSMSPKCIMKFPPTHDKLQIESTCDIVGRKCDYKVFK